MSPEQFKGLRRGLGLDTAACAKRLGVAEPDLLGWEAAGREIPETAARELARLDGMVETAVLAEVDAYTLRPERDVVLLRIMSDADLALYEPDLFDDLGDSALHGIVIERAKEAIERLGGKVTVAFMNSEFYETWLGVNDFDDSRELRIAWARQQLRGLDI